MSITLTKVTKLYGLQKALDSVSIEVNPGEIVGLLGPNGAGKSTMMKIITGILNPNEGKVQINGTTIEGNTLEIKRQIGYLPENNPLYSDLYIREYLSYAAGIYGIRNPSKRISEIIGMTGLEPEAHKKIGALSKGYRQRVGIAQALIHDPSVLILDEPTSGLDPTQLVEIRQLIKRISAEKTVLLSTHIMQEVEALCDRIIILNKGKVVAEDAPEKLRTKVSKRVVRVEYTQSVDAAKIGEIKGIEMVEQIGASEYLLSVSVEEDIRPVLFHQAVNNGWVIVTLTKEESSIEKVFLSLLSE